MQKRYNKVQASRHTNIPDDQQANAMIENATQYSADRATAITMAGVANDEQAMMVAGEATA
jgi:hypothetical protein